MVILLRFGLLGLLLCAGIAAWTWYTYSPLTQPEKKVVQASRRDAEPAKLQSGSVKKSALLLQKSDIWGSKVTQTPSLTTTSAGPAEVETWSRIAVVKDPQGAFVLLRSPAGELKTFKRGDTLPDDSKLTKISPEVVEVRKADGKTRTYRFDE